MLFPVYWMINISFTQRRSIRSGDLFPKDFTLDNYASALSSQLPYLGTSLLVAIGCVILTLAIALPSSYAIVFLEFKGSKSMNFLLIVAQMIPAVVMSLGFYQIYDDIGLLDSIPGLIVADSTFVGTVRSDSDDGILCPVCHARWWRQRKSTEHRSGVFLPKS